MRIIHGKACQCKNMYPMVNQFSVTWQKYHSETPENNSGQKDTLNVGNSQTEEGCNFS